MDRSTHQSPALAAVLLAALAVPLAAPASATTGVTTSGYTANDTSQDIAVSCKNGKISTGTTVQFNCNAVIDGNDVVTTTSQDIDSFVACIKSSEGVLTLEWSNALQPAGVSFTNLSIVLDSVGDDYHLQADCLDSDPAITDLVDAELDIGDTTNGFYNNGANGQGLLKR